MRSLQFRRSPDCIEIGHDHGHRDRSQQPSESVGQFPAAGLGENVEDFSGINGAHQNRHPAVVRFVEQILYDLPGWGFPLDPGENSS